MASKSYYLTTTDNPFNFFTENEQWERYDQDFGYYTDQLLGRLVNTAFGIPAEIDNDLIMLAIDDWLEVALPMINHLGKEVRYTRCYEP